MSWNLNSDRPIFIQIVEHLQSDIVSGVLSPGSRLPSVRELAAEASVNPNTMQRALSELERMGLMHTERTSGRFITQDADKIDRLRQDIAASRVRSFMLSMHGLGFTKEETLRLLSESNDA